MDLTDFLLARIDEDERWAQAVAGIDYGTARDRLKPDDHSRVLRDCRAKRRIVERYAKARQTGSSESWGLTSALFDLAEAYDRHPDYRPEWRQ